MDVDVVTAAPVMLDIPDETPILNLNGSKRTTANGARPGVLSPFTTRSDGGTLLRAIVYTRAEPAPDLLLAIYASDAVNVRRVEADCSEDIAAAITADRASARIVYP